MSIGFQTGQDEETGRIQGFLRKFHFADKPYDPRDNEQSLEVSVFERDENDWPRMRVCND